MYVMSEASEADVCVCVFLDTSAETMRLLTMMIRPRIYSSSRSRKAAAASK